jgi:anti-sigma factor RsiW
MLKQPEQNINDHREKLMDYLYQELSPDEAAAFELHLEQCRVCNRDLAGFRQVRASLASWELEGVPHISLAVDPHPTRSWIDRFRSLPFWMRVATVGAAAMLLLAIFNVQMSYSANGGWEFSASLLPKSHIQSPTANGPHLAGLTEEQVRALIAAAVSQVDQQHNQKIAAELDALIQEIQLKNQQRLTKLAQSLREEQEDRFNELSGQGQHPFTTLTDLLGEGSTTGY